MSTLSYLKLRFSTLRTNAWHAKLFEFVTFERLNPPKKACVYWWLVVPASLPAAGIIAIGYVCGLVAAAAILAIVSFGIYPVVMLAGLTLGYRPRHWTLLTLIYDKEDSDTAWARTSANGPMLRLRIPPVYVLLPLAVLAALLKYRHSSSHAVVTYQTYLIWAAGAIAVLTAVGAVFKYGIAPLFNKVCPDINWVTPDEAEGAVD